ncbi:MAG TPA: cob(I)yrinic acid a,c-diamide adenosyltransferase, partial [Candidatus Polarisedimenticolia bacterium]|nr:cob(I)yrinic acid a,c-diamide adenosyltransferase [Candidatus Polarisedimenticolia bacterium]
EATGAVDELNASIGLALAAAAGGPVVPLLKGIQNDLFDLGADLTVPPGTPAKRRGAPAPLRITAAHIAPLETAIDSFNSRMKPLASFVLPGGSPLAAALHQARTVCRRAERRVVSLARREPLDPEPIIYLNRLSDLLFVLARHANADGAGDVLWVPGGGR